MKFHRHPLRLRRAFGPSRVDESYILFDVPSLLRAAVRAFALRLLARGRVLLRRLRAEWAAQPKVVRVGAAPALIAALPVLALFQHVYFDRSGLPDIEPFVRFEPPTTGEIYDAHGQMLIELAREYRRVLRYEEVPPVVRQAILSAEDRHFFSHGGVDYLALPRVLLKTIRHSAAASRGGRGFRLVFPQGGSTLTQQLVRGYFLHDLTRREDGDALVRESGVTRALSRLVGPSATNKLVRKVEEIRLAVWVEEEMLRRFGSRSLAKREILARYASFIYLGNGRYGFAAASDYYFGRPLSTLTVDDADAAALLAGITKSPGEYAPNADGVSALRRRNDILLLMARNGYLRGDVARRLQARPIRLAARPETKTVAPAAVETVFSELRRLGDARFDVPRLVAGRIRVHTTVDNRLQRVVNEALESGLALYEQRHPGAKGLVQGSVVVLRNADGAILAEAGGRQVFKDRPIRYSDYNRVTDSSRQPGSVFKPLVYLAAFRAGSTLDTVVPDAPIAVPMGGGRPPKWISNYDERFKGPIPIRQALAESRNAATVWVARTVGVPQVLRTARELGIRSRLQPYITTALGASEVTLLELANAYRAMASGLLAEPHVIERISDAEGRPLLSARGGVRPLRDPEGALPLIQEALRGVVRLPGGTAHALDLSRFPIPVMGKTGTTSDFRDALFVGSTYGPGGITVAVRVGFDDNRELGPRETGGRTALPIFREIMLRAYTPGLLGRPPQFPEPIEKGIDQYLAYLWAEPPEQWAAPEPPPLLAVPAIATMDGAAAPPPSAETADKRGH